MVGEIHFVDVVTKTRDDIVCMRSQMTGSCAHWIEQRHQITRRRMNLYFVCGRALLCVALRSAQSHHSCCVVWNTKNRTVFTKSLDNMGCLMSRSGISRDNIFFSQWRSHILEGLAVSCHSHTPCLFSYIVLATARVASLEERLSEWPRSVSLVFTSAPCLHLTEYMKVGMLIWQISKFFFCFFYGAHCNCLGAFPALNIAPKSKLTLVILARKTLYTVAKLSVPWRKTVEIL